MKVALVQYWFAAAGGLEQHSTNLAIALKRRGLDVHVFTELPANSDNEYVTQLCSSAVKVTSPPDKLPDKSTLARSILNFWIRGLVPIGLYGASLLRGKNSRRRARLTQTYLKQINSKNLTRLVAACQLSIAHWRQPFDVVHIHGFRLETGWALRWAHHFNVPCVYTEHSSINHWLNFPGMDIEAVKLADIVTSVSLESCRQLQALTSISNIKMLRHIVSQPAAEDLKTDIRPIENAICVASLTKNKGIQILLDTVALLAREFPELHFDILGDGPERLLLERQAADKNIGGMVTFHGRLKNREVLEWIQRSDFMVLPSLSEGLPMSLLEGLSYGKPVIACNTGGVPELVIDGVNGLLVECGNQQELAKAIRSVVKDSRLWQKMATVARRVFVEGLYDEASVIESVTEMYTSAIAMHSGPDQQTTTGLQGTVTRAGSITPLLSVVIPTHASRFLDRTLEALVNQSEKRFEVLVVENGAPSEDTLKASEAYASSLSLRYFYHPVAGLNHARNIGTRNAKSAIICLLDDDCIPNKNWATEILLAHTEHPHAGVIGGATGLEFLGNPEAWVVGPLKSILSELDYGSEARSLQIPEYLVGANLSFRKSVFQQAGEFNEGLGPAQSNSMQGCNDEIEFIDRAARTGNPGMLYIPNIKVKHLIPDKRISKSYFQTRQQIQGRSDVDLGHIREPERDQKRWLRQLYDDFSIRGWLGRLNAASRNLSESVKEQLIRTGILMHIAYLVGVQERIISNHLPAWLSEEIRARRLKFYQSGLAWVKRRYSTDYKYHPDVYVQLQVIMLKMRFGWARNDRFTLVCILGRIDFLKGVSDGLNGLLDSPGDRSAGMKVL